MSLSRQRRRRFAADADGLVSPADAMLLLGGPLRLPTSKRSSSPRHLCLLVPSSATPQVGATQLPDNVSAYLRVHGKYAQESKKSPISGC